ncbi:MAG: substrate-binding domain-containing protein [Spirochaetales bacterium]
MNVNDMTAVRVMHAAMRRGIRIPEDLSLTGFDNLSQSRDSPIALTTVDQKFGEIVGEAIRRLVAADQSRSMPANGEYVVMPNVIMRNSVRSL